MGKKIALSTALCSSLTCFYDDEMTTTSDRGDEGDEDDKDDDGDDDDDKDVTMNYF